MINELGFLSWAGRQSNLLWVVIRILTQRWRKTHDGADSRTTLAEGQLAQQMAQACCLYVLQLGHLLDLSLCWELGEGCLLFEEGQDHKQQA